MTIAIDAIVDAVVSHAMTTGYFEKVNAYEPKTAPGYGLTCSVWPDEIRTIAEVSGLDKTTAMINFKVQLRTPFIQEPMEAIDPNLIKALDALLTLYNGDFSLDGLVKNVDIFGAHSDGIVVLAAYIDQDNIIYRAFEIDLPLILNDVWDQVA